MLSQSINILSHDDNKYWKEAIGIVIKTEDYVTRHESFEKKNQFFSDARERTQLTFCSQSLTNWKQLRLKWTHSRSAIPIHLHFAHWFITSLFRLISVHSIFRITSHTFPNSRDLSQNEHTLFIYRTGTRENPRTGARRVDRKLKLLQTNTFHSFSNKVPCSPWWSAKKNIRIMNDEEPSKCLSSSLFARCSAFLHSAHDLLYWKVFEFEISHPSKRKIDVWSFAGRH